MMPRQSSQDDDTRVYSRGSGSPYVPQIEGTASYNLAAATAAQVALRELASSALADREMAIADVQKVSAVAAALRADAMTLKAQLAEARGRCTKGGE